jgi:hypothetical protein
MTLGIVSGLPEIAWLHLSSIDGIWSNVWKGYMQKLRLGSPKTIS